MANDILFLPVANSFRFYLENSPEFLTGQEWNNLTFDGLNPVCYAQKYVNGEERQVQFLSNYDTNTVELIDRNGAVVTTFTASIVFDGLSNPNLGYAFYQFNFQTTQTPGFYKIRITGNPGAVIWESEFIAFANEWEKTLLVEFSNCTNEDNLYFGDGFIISNRVESRFYRATPTTTRTFFRDSGDKPSVLASRKQRKYLLNLYNLPPYLQEQLSIGFALDQIRILGNVYVSEEGLNAPEYQNLHYLLANNTVTVEAVDRYNLPVEPFPCNDPPVTALVLDTGEALTLPGDIAIEVP